MTMTMRQAQAMKSHEQSAHGLLTILLVALAALVGLGMMGGLAYQRAAQRDRLAAMMGPKQNLASLPEIKVTLDGSRTLDLKVSLELASGAKKRFSERTLDRINDRIQEQVSQIEPDRLVGANSAQVMKRAIASAVNHETTPGVVKEVLIERMLVYSGNANIPLATPEPTEVKPGMPFPPPRR